MSHVPSRRESELCVDGIVSDTPPTPSVEVIQENLAWILRNVYTQEECEALIRESERLGFDSLESEYRSDYRKNDRLIIDNEVLAADFYKRVAPYIPEEVTIRVGDPVFGFGVDGVWEKKNLSPHLRICRYQPGGFFCAHQDGHYMANSETRSFFTCMLYLNGNFDGGETNFLDREKSHVVNGPAVRLADPEAITHSIKPVPGLVLLFWHPMLHEGGAVTSGQKYMMRTEVMFQRREKTAAPMTESDKEAVMLFEQATLAEAEGRYDEAAGLYRRAFKKSQKLADAYQS